MDEMTEVRALRAHAPVPDRARLAAGRALLTDAVRAGERRRAGWWRREFVIVAVVAAVTAVAVTAALLVGGGGTGRRVQPATPDLDLKGMSAHDFLERSADALEKQPTGTEPTGKQWICTSTAMKPGHGERSSVYWRRYDGELRAYHPADGDPELTVIPAHLRSQGPDDYDSPRDVYRFLAALPADGGGTLRALRKRNAVRDDGSQAWDDYAEISQLLKVDLVPPAGLASLYRALALLPGGSVTDHLVDTVTGRKAVALTYDITPVGTGKVSGTADSKAGGKAWGVAQTLIDPRTCHVVGWRTVVNGKVTIASERLTTAVVDKAGERP
ncbi:CU044_5270 family protein [Streptomyces sp. NPDC048417]|uniref:CU044_5270 family protein n=1 Tax=Streptomyces sp. NPDC048417 TaxID=3155387 RepID=UPI003419AAC9